MIQTQRHGDRLVVKSSGPPDTPFWLTVYEGYGEEGDDAVQVVNEGFPTREEMDSAAQEYEG